MGLTYINLTVRDLIADAEPVSVDRVLVDTGAELTWLPATKLETAGIEVRPAKRRKFRMADGRVVERDVGYGILRVADGYETVDEVVFGQANDGLLLGARTLEGLGCRVDPEQHKLVATGPSVAAGQPIKHTNG